MKRKNKLNRTTFTQEMLKDIYDTGQVTMERIQDVLPDWTRRAILERLAGWRCRGNITYKLNPDGDIEAFEFLRIGRKKVEKARTKGELIKAWFYYGVIERELEIATDSTSNKNQIQKADDLIAKHISRIPTELLEIFTNDLPEELGELLKTKRLGV